MAKRKPAPVTKRPKRETLAHRLYHDILKQRFALTHPCSDKEMNAGLDLLSSLTASLASAPAENATDVRLKIEILCARLREHLHPENAGELLSYLLADSIRDDLLMASASAEPDVKRL